MFLSQAFPQQPRSVFEEKNVNREVLYGTFFLRKTLKFQRKGGGVYVWHDEDKLKGNREKKTTINSEW